MQFDLYEWASIYIGIFDTYIIYKFMAVFFDTRKYSRKIELLTYGMYYLLSMAIFVFVNIPIILMFFNIAAFFALTYNYEAAIKNRIISVAFIYLTVGILEIVGGLLTGYLDFSLSATNKYSSIFGLIACRIVMFAVVLIMNNFKNIKKGKPVPTSNWFAIALVPTASLYITLLLFLAQGLTVMQIMIGVVLIWIINFATFYLYDVVTAAISDKMQNRLVLEQNKYYDNQLEMIKSSLQTTSAIRHDLKNHMFSIRSLVENGDANESLNYISKIMDDIGARKDYSNSGNTVIDSIVNFKFQEAEQRGIKANLDLKIPERLDIPSFDITIILGNLLDNAIKAAAQAEGNRFINLKIRFDKGRLLIQADNPYAGIINEKDGKLLTTNVDKKNHGIGLETVKKTVQKYNGTTDIDYKGNIFSISLLMYVE